MVSVRVRIWRAFLPENEALHALGQSRRMRLASPHRELRMITQTAQLKKSGLKEASSGLGHKCRGSKAPTVQSSLRDALPGTKGFGSFRFHSHHHSLQPRPSATL